MVAIIRQAPPSTLSMKASWSFFEVVELRASKSALGVGPKAPTSEDPVPVTQLRRAGVRGWLQVVAATGTAVSETVIFASSICHCNIITLVHVKILIVGNTGCCDVEIDLAGSDAWKACKLITSSLCAFGHGVMVIAEKAR